LNKGDLEDFDQAAAESRRAKDLDANLLEVHRARGLVLVNSGIENLDQAIQELKAAIAINDKIADLHLNLGFAYRVAGENDLAVDELLAAYALNPTNSNIPTEIAFAYANEGQFGKPPNTRGRGQDRSDQPRMHGTWGSSITATASWIKPSRRWPWRCGGRPRRRVVEIS
jgi:tetratricopeptide (TPR) repeat protein